MHQNIQHTSKCSVSNTKLFTQNGYVQTKHVARVYKVSLFSSWLCPVQLYSRTKILLFIQNKPTDLQGLSVQYKHYKIRGWVTLGIKIWEWNDAESHLSIGLNVLTHSLLMTYSPLTMRAELRLNKNILNTKGTCKRVVPSIWEASYSDQNVLRNCCVLLTNC